uniref:Uncharacterized protein n=1 Tax=Culicoides sonorensis TaxID=179676 RepID=Q5QBK5_CULSO|nr:unknown [Culicoides sonorensis]
MAFVALASANLQNDFEDLAKLVPGKEIAAVAEDYLKHDREFLKLALYFKSKDFKNLWVDVFAEEYVHELVDYCEDHGVAAVESINYLADLLGLPHYPSLIKMNLRMIESRRTGGIAGFFKDVDALVPYTELKKAMDAKYVESADFKGFMDLVDVDRFDAFMKTNKNAQKFVKFLKDNKVDVNTYWNHLKDLFKH